MAAADDVDRWVMANAVASSNIGPFQFDVVNANAAWGVNTDTQKRDVSEILDLLALADTPFINKVGWGPESGGTVIEWITEDLGPGYITNLSVTGSGAAAGISIILNSIDAVQGSDLSRQLHEGTVLYTYNSVLANSNIRVITSEPAVSGVNVTIHASVLEFTAYGTEISSNAVDTKFFILGNVQNEGSTPGYGRPRQRKVASNQFTILREDVAITGSMKNTDMYVIGREDRHQILMRMKEMQRNREKIGLYSVYVSAKSSTVAGLPNGVFGFLNSQSGNHIDRSTRALTETAVNTVVSHIWERGGRNLSFFGHLGQTAKFTRWDKNRIRQRPNDRVGGGYITSYQTEAGIDLDLIPMGNVPRNLAFVLDTSKVDLRAKKNRKAIMEMLGKKGDFDAWQILSEFSLEMRGFNLAQHGMFTSLI